MSITVHEAINLPVMKSTKLLAGATGLHNQINWVTIVEVIEDINRFQQGEFLITTGYGLNENSLHFQKLLAMKRLSGIAIYSGFYLKEIPQIFLALANKHHLPLIELPTELNFSTVTKSILQEILHKQMETTFLEDLINNYVHSSAILHERGKKLGINLSLSQVVLQIKLDNEFSQEHLDLLYHHFFRMMELKERQFLLRTGLDGLTLLTEVHSEKRKSLKQDSLDLAEEILLKWKEKNPQISIIIGIGKSYDTPNQLSESAKEAKYAVDLANLLSTKKEIIHYDDLATFHLLLQMKELGISLKQFYEEQIGELLSNNKGIDYIHTLEVYFQQNLNLQSTAEKLFIHRHTLKYRLQQIENRFGLNTGSVDERLKIQLAIAAYKLEKYFSS
ncbi:PucR family transcriptional regulator [Robertmurraya kyonggiensis]|uniref:PucR family transcriptional regulator n=1 Tax=Robertmurraya kyonggiensis TaxID=1037680 RepID=A0A4V5P1X9_9BACI|nr:PucR family transcriptional regulator [Robertmurraya kyonggiensis]TKC18140.1 hypothetical protein FA727_00860 [Robertmurraya kyonggiensis]